MQAAVVGALLDRLHHHATVIRIEGASYRLRLHGLNKLPFDIGVVGNLCLRKDDAKLLVGTRPDSVSAGMGYGSMPGTRNN